MWKTGACELQKVGMVELKYSDVNDLWLRICMYGELSGLPQCS
jgi:hypothetical protein